MKKWLHIETSQQELQKQDKKEKVEKHILTSPISNSKPISVPCFLKLYQCSPIIETLVILVTHPAPSV